ncbi:DUF4145 domain-containing protein [Pseudomonas gingeri]|uniref:DUF4145 domain-containing protein n=1 Tax=Pseudomonas gingeri TaxID=117681 RepID=A0A7Y7XL41_9PSED|nr:DUF4145 domain-containing protein [Pseudomonas gingeri]NWC00844.1 DUF4145 domain-containing protein [Pseudomonas gingeri]
MAQNYVAPAFRLEAFTCVYCGVLSQMHWSELCVPAHGGIMSVSWAICTCQHCRSDTIWKVSKEDSKDVFMAYPNQVNAPATHQDLPEVCRADFDEARLICGVSPRGAAALLRLCLEKLLGHLGCIGDINKKIGALVQSGLDPHIQQALDVVRVTGNNAVHPLDMSHEDLVSNVPVMFEMINLIVDERIARQRKVAERFANLPEKARQAIEKRDMPKA